MNWMFFPNKDSLRIKPFTALIIGFSASLLVLISAILLSYRATRNLQTSFQWVDHTHQVVEELEFVLSTIHACEGKVRGYGLTQKPEFIDNYPESIRLIHEKIHFLRTLTQDNAVQQPRIDSLEQAARQRIALMEYSIALVQKRITADHATILRKLDEANVLMEQIRQIKHTIERTEKQLLRERQQRAYNRLSHAETAIVISGILSIITASFIGVFLYRYVRQRKRIIQELTVADENKTRFFSIISHDLRGPLGNNLLLLQMLTDETQPPSPEESRQIIGMLETSAKRTSALLENLLTWARLQMNRVECKPELIDLQKITTDNLDVLQPSASLKNISLVNHVAADTLAYADKNMIQTVIRNLVSNAIKFTPVNGEVSVTATPNCQRVEIAVRDTGVGIKPEVLKELFKLSTKHSTKGTANEEGSGLGLLLCREFVEKNGGSIRVESQPTTGSTFTVQLPMTAY